MMPARFARWRHFIDIATPLTFDAALLFLLCCHAMLIALRAKQRVTAESAAERARGGYAQRAVCHADIILFVMRALHFDACCFTPLIA